MLEYNGILVHNYFHGFNSKDRYALIFKLDDKLDALIIELNEEALVRIMKEPKNSVLKQYTKLFSMEDVDIEFTEDACNTVAKLAIERNTGARGIRSIIEEAMLPVMFEVPSRKDIKKVVVTADFIEGKEPITFELK